MTKKELITKARNTINVGWCQRVPMDFDENGVKCHCAVAAFDAQGITDNEDYLAVAEKVRDSIVTLHPAYEHIPRYGMIVSFNDKPGRTKEEVLAVFDHAIAACE